MVLFFGSVTGVWRLTSRHCSQRLHHAAHSAFSRVKSVVCVLIGMGWYLLVFLLSRLLLGFVHFVLVGTEIYVFWFCSGSLWAFGEVMVFLVLGEIVENPQARLLV